MEKIAAKAPVATLMQPLQYDLRISAAKDTSTASTKNRKSHLETARARRSSMIPR